MLSKLLPSAAALTSLKCAPAAPKRSLLCQRALTQKRTLPLVREGPAYSSDCSVELPLRPSARAAAPLGPSSLAPRLRAWWRQVVRHVKER